MGPLRRVRGKGIVKFRGVVLAGGKSRRFGEDKALTPIDGAPMIQKIVQCLDELDLSPAVITRAAERYPFLDCRIESDLVPEKGPLGGIYTACSLFPDCSLVVLTCDMPFLTPEAVRFLMDRHEPSSLVTLYNRDKTLKQPFPGVYESSLKDLIAQKINREDLSLQTFLQEISGVRCLERPSDPRTFLNINEKQNLP